MPRRPWRRFGVVAATALTGALMLSGITAPAIAASTPNTTCTSMTLAKVQARVLADVNAARKKAGASALASDAAMNTVATTWAQKQAAAKRMSHNPSYAKQIPSGWNAAGENVAYGYAPSSVTKAWMGSAGHRKNIETKAYTRTGIGVACDSSGRPYYSQVFGAYKASAVKTTGSAASASVPVSGFTVKTHVQKLGWISGGGTTGSGLRIEALKVTQTQSTERLCLRAHVAKIGWMKTQCTSGKGTTITVGTTGRSLALQALEVSSPNKAVSARAHVQSIGWQSMRTTSGAGKKTTIGTTGRGLRLEFVQLKP